MLIGQNGFGHKLNPCTELPTFMLYSILRYDWNIRVQNGMFVLKYVSVGM